MPLVSISFKEEIVGQYELLQTIEEKCKKSIFFAKGKESDKTFIYSVSIPIPPKCNTMVAISQYGKRYAMLTPEDLTEKELVVFEFVLQDVEPDAEIIVFSRRDYSAVKKYLCGKKNVVLLST